MTTNIRRAFLLVLFFCCAAPVAAQPGSQPGDDTQGGIGSLLGGPRRAKPQPSAPPAGREPTPAERQAAASAALDRQIASLEATLASTKPTGLASVSAARDLTMSMRQRVDQMRKEFYISDPSADSAVVTALASLQARWGDLGTTIAQGQIPDVPLEAGRWNDYARGFSRLYCDQRTVPSSAPATGVPLVGFAWACVSDRFFSELAPLEAGVSRTLAVKRAIATEPIERAMGAAEAAVKDILQMDPVHRFALQRLAELLRDVDRMVTELRIKELKTQRNSGEGNAAFRWLLAMSGAVTRPSTIPKLTITLDEASAVLGGLPSRNTASQSERLHRIHYKHALLEAGAEAPPNVRAGLDVQRARALAELAEAASR